MNNRQHIQKKHPSQSTYTPVQNLYQTRAFDIQQQPSHSSSGQENVDLDADHEQSQYKLYNLPYIPVNAPGTEPPPPIQTQLNSGEPTNYYQQGSADVPWYNRPTYPNIPVNAPGTEPPPPIQTKLTIGQPGDKYEQEADQVASQVVQQINSPVPVQSAQGQTVQREDATPFEEEQVQAKSISDTIQREELPEEEELQMSPMLQRQGQGGMAATPDLETSINQARGGGMPLAENLQRSMGKAMGADFSGVKVHTDSQSDQLNKSIQAKAFTTGQDVFFRQGSYEPSSRGGQELIAHELTHVVQQTGTIQRYHTKHKDFRTSDDGQIAVHQKNSVGGQTAYATPALIKDASAKLKAATSVIKLEPGKLSTKLDDLSGKKHDVVDVVPINTQNKTKDMDMELWADCGRSAATVSGMDTGTGQGNANPNTKYNKDGQTKTVGGTDWMEIKKVKMFVDFFNKKSSLSGLKLDIATINQKLTNYNTIKQKWQVEADATQKNNYAQQMAQLASEMDDLSRAEYEKLSPDAKDDFDKKAGINMYADPNIGEAFHISTGGKDHPDKPADVGTWNFHWAGVIMKSGSDTMTLENYSVGDYTKENKDWVFQMYGVGKKGQSFHEEHKDVHKQHGDAPTSLVAVRPKSQEE